MNRRTPTRLRDMQQASAPRPRSHRLPMMALSGLLALVVAALGYGLVERNLLRPHVDATVERSDMYVRAGEHIQINVMNACGVDGIATKFTEFLRARRFDVPEYGNHERRVRYSTVIDRIGDPLSARKVAYALGISSERIETDIDSSLYLRATVIIGEDYVTLRPMR